MFHQCSCPWSLWEVNHVGSSQMVLPADTSMFSHTPSLLLGLWKVVRNREPIFCSPVAYSIWGSLSPSPAIFELSFTAPVWFTIISLVQEGRMGQRQMKLLAEGHTAIRWWCCSAAFQCCLTDKVILSPSRVPKGGILAQLFSSHSSCTCAEWNWTGEPSWLQTCCQVHCLSVCGAVWQESAGGEGTGTLVTSEWVRGTYVTHRDLQHDKWSILD